MTCDTCGQDKAVTLTHEVRIGKRVVSWRICVPCERRERALGDDRATAAIEQAERAGA